MLVSNKIGGLPLISSIFDHGPSAAYGIAFIAGFGIVCMLMVLEGLSFRGVMPWNRPFYWAALWGDFVFLPLWVGMVTVVLERAAPMNGFYTSPWWHASLLIGGFIVSVSIEVGAVKAGQYTMSQEFSPSKLWHTFIFGIVFYWLASSFIPVIMEAFLRPQMWHLLVLVAAVGFFFNSYRDATLPFPEDAHLEGSWSQWDWHRRKY